MISLFDLIGRRVWSHVQGQDLGLVTGAVMDEEKGRLTDLIVKRSWWGPRYFLGREDILYLADKVIVQEESDLYRQEDVVRLKKSYRRRDFPLVGYRVVDRRGQKIGYCRNIWLDQHSFFLASILIVRFVGWRWQERIIARNQILGIKDQVIVVKNGLVRGRHRATKKKGFSLFKKAPAYTYK